MIGLPNPYVLAGALVAMIGIGGSAYFAGKHAQETSDKVQAQAIEIAQAKVIANLEAIANGKEVTAQSEVDHQRDTYEAQLQQTQALVSQLTATGNGLRRQLAAYSGGPDMSQTAAPPLCPADSRVNVLAGSLADLADAGAGVADQLRSCAIQLQALEGWAAAVQHETGQTP